MKSTLLVFQLGLTLVILAIVPGNFLKAGLLLPLWWVSFGGLSRREMGAFLMINLLFVISDIGAIQNGFFQFTSPDVFGLPIWEFFMWGFYLLHSHRMFPVKAPRLLDLKLLALALVFSQLFAVVSDQQLLLVLTSAVLAISLFFYHAKDDLLYCGYLMMMGIATEYVGLHYNLWGYPGRDYQTALIQFVVMWGASGLYFRHIMGPWLRTRVVTLRVYPEQHTAMDESFTQAFHQARRYAEDRRFSDSHLAYSEIADRARRESVSLSYDFYLSYSQMCISSGNLRKGVELSREALPLATSNLERAFVHLQLCRVYRMMIMMRNARTELNQAFGELGLEAPKASALYAMKAILIYGWRSLWPLAPVSDEVTRHFLQVQVALLEEAGLSAYYFVEYSMLIQCPLLAKHPAMRLGPSMQLINWQGGSACVWAIVGWSSRAKKLIGDALKTAHEIPEPYARAKAHLWNALYLNYRDRPKEAALEFESCLSDPNLSPYDVRLAATTLSCNYLIRGKMQSADASIRHMTDREVLRGRYFSSGKAYVDWYRLPALGFIGDASEARDVLKSSEVVFDRVDEERWQITLFLGGLLNYFYSQKERDLKSIRGALARFDALGLSPRLTYLEAAQIWVAKAHLFVDLAIEGEIKPSEAHRAVRELSRAPDDSNLRAHWLIAKAKLMVFERTSNFKAADFLAEQALKIADRNDNEWVRYEVLRYRNLKSVDETEKGRIDTEIREFKLQNQWRGARV